MTSDPKLPMPYDRGRMTARLTSPLAMLLAGLLTAFALGAMPTNWTNPARDGVAKLLRPGQHSAMELRRWSSRTAARVRSHFQEANELAKAEGTLRRLEQENRRLSAELAAVQSAHEVSPAVADQQPLLLPRLVEARILGQQARAYLARYHLLDIGHTSLVEPDALVLDCPMLIDRGRDASVQRGELVLRGSRVWGKVVELGSHTATVRAMTEPGYRDLVRIGDPTGPEGVLEGTGEPTVRVRLVDVTEPVSVGDAVYSAAGRGVTEAPLLCGRVSRLERPTGSTHWDIWMQPAIIGQPQRVAVMRMEPNPSRVAATPVKN